MLKKHLLILALAAFLPALALTAPQTHIAREAIEWCDVWIAQATDTTLPRVLLIGDSITRGYSPKVDALLKGKANVGRLATSAAVGSPELLGQVKLVLATYKFDVIHFNNGLHGWDYTEEEYAKNLPALLATIRQSAPHARLIWAASTPVRTKGDLKTLDPKTDRVKARNRIAAALMKKEGIPIDDLFALVLDHPEFTGADGVHFNPKGVDAQAAQVAQAVSNALK